MILRRFMKHVTDQNWFVGGLDEIVVVMGIFLGLQVQAWFYGVLNVFIFQRGSAFSLASAFNTLFFTVNIFQPSIGIFSVLSSFSAS